MKDNIKNKMGLADVSLLKDPQMAGDPLLRRYLELQVNEMEMRQKERESSETEQRVQYEKRKVSQLRDAHEAEEKRKLVENNQQHCSHMQGALSLVRGQRLGRGIDYIICQFCLRNWKSWADVPPRLHCPAEYYGGPSNY